MHAKVLIVLTTILSYCESTQYYNKDSYPNLRTDPKTCGQLVNNKSKLHICDPDHILNDYQLRKLNNDLLNFEKHTECICDNCKEGQLGIKGYIAIANNIYRSHQAHDEEEVMYMANHIRKQWSLGTCGDDFLIFLAVNDNLMYTSLGYETKTYLDPDFTRDTGAKSSLSKKDPYTMLSNIIGMYRSEVRDVREGMNQAPPEPKDHTGLIVGAVVGGIIGIILIIILVVVIIKSGKMKQTNIHGARQNTDPEVKIRQTGSVLYSSVNKEDPGDGDTDTKIPIDTDEKADDENNEKKDTVKENKDTIEEKKDTTEEKKDDTPEKTDKKESPKGTPPPVAPKPKNTPPPPNSAPPPPTSAPPPPDSEPPTDSSV